MLFWSSFLPGTVYLITGHNVTKEYCRRAGNELHRIWNIPVVGMTKGVHDSQTEWIVTEICSERRSGTWIVETISGFLWHHFLECISFVNWLCKGFGRIRIDAEREVERKLPRGWCSIVYYSKFSSAFQRTEWKFSNQSFLHKASHFTAIPY